MGVDFPVAFKAGLIGAAAGLLVALMGSLPFLGCVCWPPGGLLVAVATGVLYVHFASSDDKVMAAREGALGGAESGAMSGLAQVLVRYLFSAFGINQALIGKVLFSALGLDTEGIFVPPPEGFNPDYFFTGIGRGAIASALTVPNHSV